MTYNRIRTHPIAGNIGAEISGVDLSDSVDDETFAEIHRALLEHLAIFFRDQRLTPEQHLALARRFGPLDPEPFDKPLTLPRVDGHPEILVVVKEPENQGINFGGIWHYDVTFRARPILGNVVYALEVPDHGGDTMFGNMYLAYETLTDGLKAQLAGMKAVHTALRTYETERFAARYGVDPRAKDLDGGLSPEATNEMEHPVVRTHPESGRKALFVGRAYTTRFAGMSEIESAPLLEYLHRHAEKPEFTCRFRWRKGSVAIWDNRCATHCAINDYHGQRRVVHRVSIDGDRPV